jgi:hypothetical protein
MISSNEAREIIIKGAREIFPQILPSRLQEARSALLSHLNMEISAFGFFPSGGAKFENYCSQVVKILKESGEMTTKGWVWEWNTKTQSLPVIEMSMADLFESELEVGVAPSLYNLSCEETLIRLIATTSCFGKVLESDPECQGCPLLTFCRETKGEEYRAKKEAKEAKLEALQEAMQAGYDLKNVKVPKSARLFESYNMKAMSATSCIVSGEAIAQGEDCTVIPSWGIVKPIIAEAFKSIA